MITEEELADFKKKFELLEKITIYKIKARLAQIQNLYNVPAVNKINKESINVFQDRIHIYQEEYWALRSSLNDTIEQRDAILADAELPGLGAVGANALFIENTGSDIALPELSIYHKDLLKQYASQLVI